MVLKRCECSNPARCEHPWHINLNLRANGNTKPERGPVTKYLHLLDAGALVPVTKAEAVNLEARVRAWVLQGRPTLSPVVPPEPEADPARITVEVAGKAYVRDYVYEELKSPAGEEGIINRIVEAFGVRTIEVLQDRATVRGYLKGVEARTSQSTSNHHYARWSHFLNWVRHEYKLPGESPFYHRTLRPQGLKKHTEGESRQRRLQLPLDEEPKMLDAFAHLDDGGMMIGRWYCALDAMLRRGEMLQLKRAHVKHEKVHGARVVILHVHSANAKSGKPREVPVMTERLLEFLDRRTFAPYPFGQADGSILGVSPFRTDWEKSLVRAGICDRDEAGNLIARHPHEILHWHDLRHEGASRLHENHMPLRQIQKILGHASLATTERYLNPTDHGMIEDMRRVALAMGLRKTA